MAEDKEVYSSRISHILDDDPSYNLAINSPKRSRFVIKIGIGEKAT